MKHLLKFYRRRTVGSCLVLAAAIFGSASARSGVPDEPRPNLLLILADDLGYGDVSTYHRSDVLTPNLDRLAAEGMLFTRMRANATVCSPSRAALLTGKYADRVGVPGVIRTQAADSWGYFDPKTRTLPDLLRKGGYHTAHIGKWHLGLESPNTPTERGFQFFHGFLGDMMDSYTTHRREGHNYMRRNRKEIDRPGHATEIFTQWARDYLHSRAKSRAPFFLYLAYNAPHFPIEPPAASLAKVKARAPSLDPKRALNVAMVEHLDEQLGLVLETLRETGQDRNTLIAFTSDNGGSLAHAQNNDPWRDGKQSHYDGGLRVPFIVRWPGKVAPGTRSDYAGLGFDLFATFLEASGRKTSKDLDAVSLLSHLRGGGAPAGPRDLYFVRREGGPAYGGKAYEALIRGDWKLMQNSPYSPLELYNLKDDPQERTNLIVTRPQIARELNQALRLHIQRGGQTSWQRP